MKAMTPARSFSRRTALARRVAWLAAGGLLAGCSPEAPTFKSTDIAGAAFAQNLRLTDHTGQVKTMVDFRGKAVVVFFGFTQCPDVCPTSMTTLAEVKRLMGDQGQRLQVLFITVDPERDTQPLLKEYMANFDPTFLALRPEPSEVKAVADSFKTYYRKAEGSTPTSYTMDHSAGKYVFDTEGRVRLFSSYGTEPGVIAEDILTLLKSVEA
ncbi:MAG: photosynthetic protein synthase I [Burkholderiales bacterium RIFCSPLOWO2_12_FULL_65_40]|jgi:protein SCO1/2|nr:MAG: photosynthetic protein synthase I [Burkholderiales bacterium RIFCSPHIGHO2_12_63_9]OGB46115.1 MAG: photosynthetic protein synthase I [Burkholderiales bacterium RIFCSPLOWO2_12_FULL_65_40]